MDDSPLINQTSYIFAGIMLIFSFYLFYNDTQLFWKSLFAALLAAFLFWFSYVLVRWLFLALKR
ncbi:MULTISPECIES: hypothetical protein [Parachlamydia]|jgi:hypothetical protein|uniref:Uncharacterized protein n=2 Tax=Parachlamydia acanthamoebae TaxID=83552 RepID=F8KZH7_PARAV|nr:hypothetical protein [Parachlamydia acanthamoebae]EFB41796.1 hypothetical protein pah_c022o080 [Parachlamydia acanthamoebae str. Hall's coccus]KIA77971.1 hypothetical protein DB43_FG00300 [Parachlamydia acanthamoebae]CCB86317.1 putative uncharacterized protein [Parachlamydia acanthamoebae UV-7]